MRVQIFAVKNVKEQSFRIYIILLLLNKKKYPNFYSLISISI
jgi:hypothetical protein